VARSDEIREELQQTQDDLDRTASEVGDRVEGMAASVEEKLRPPARKTQRVARAAKAVVGWMRNPFVLMATATAVSLVALGVRRGRHR
jgi:hypothetical protein